MTVKLIVAVDQLNAIGWKDGRLPWKISEDMKRFKTLTTGHYILMGMNTFKTLPPTGLPNRMNVVLTQSQPNHQGNPQFFNHQNALKTYVQVHQAHLGGKPQDLWIIGGASVYTQALDLQLVDELYVTQVHCTSGADVSLPFELYNWKLFVLRERALGVNWELVETEPAVSPEISVFTLRKV